VIGLYSSLSECPTAENELSVLEEEWSQLNPDWLGSAGFTEIQSLKPSDNILSTVGNW
jgi:hypothetical protein